MAAPLKAPEVAASSRGALGAQGDALKALHQQVVQIQAMAPRNAKDKALSQQIACRLEQARAPVTPPWRLWGSVAPFLRLQS